MQNGIYIIVYTFEMCLLFRILLNNLKLKFSEIVSIITIIYKRLCQFEYAVPLFYLGISSKCLSLTFVLFTLGIGKHWIHLWSTPKQPTSVSFIIVSNRNLRWQKSNLRSLYPEESCFSTVPVIEDTSNGNVII